MIKEDIKKILSTTMDEIKYLQQNSEKLEYEDFINVDYKAIWDIIKNKIPKLKLQIENILSEVENANEA